MKDKAKDIAIRAGKTFIQAFIAALPITAATIEGGVMVWKSALIGALAAGLSAVMNLALAALAKDGESNGD